MQIRVRTIFLFASLALWLAATGAISSCPSTPLELRRLRIEQELESVEQAVDAMRAKMHRIGGVDANIQVKELVSHIGELEEELIQAHELLSHDDFARASMLALYSKEKSRQLSQRIDAQLPSGRAAAVAEAQASKVASRTDGLKPVAEVIDGFRTGRFELVLSKASEIALRDALAHSRAGLPAQVIKALTSLSVDPEYPALKSHVMVGYDKKYGVKGPVFTSYVQSNSPQAYRVLWHYGPQPGQITILYVGPHY